MAALTPARSTKTLTNGGAQTLLAANAARKGFVISPQPAAAGWLMVRMSTGTPSASLGIRLELGKLYTAADLGCPSGGANQTTGEIEDSHQGAIVAVLLGKATSCRVETIEYT